MVILSLDLANSCGYAVCKDNKIVDYGVWNLVKHKRGECSQSHHKLYKRLENIVLKYKITHIVTEDVYVPTNVKDDSNRAYNALKSLLMLHGVVSLFCENYNIINCKNISANKSKQFMFNATCKMGREVLKKQMILSVESLGYTLPANHKDDVADAIGVLCTYLGEKIKA